MINTRKYFSVGTENGVKLLKYEDIRVCRKWYNIYGNPTWSVLMADGNKYILVDDYGFAGGFSPVGFTLVKRKKDL